MKNLRLALNRKPGAATLRAMTRLMLVTLTAGLLAGCASRKEVLQFQADHQEFRARFENLDKEVDELDVRMARIEQQQDTLRALLGGNVRQYMRDQEELLRSMKADQKAVSGDLERLIVTLSSRVDESEQRIQKLLMQLDTFNQLVTEVLGDSLAGGSHDVTEAQRLFQQSYSDFLHGEQEVARLGFQEYVEKYPTTSMADDALYWIGETYLAEEKPDSAREAFIQLEDRYPDSNRMPAALLKRAILRADAGDETGAKRLYRRILDTYPGSDEAEQARLRLGETTDRPK